MLNSVKKPTWLKIWQTNKLSVKLSVHVSSNIVIKLREKNFEEGKF